MYTCRLHAAMVNVSTTASLLTLLAIAADRFLFIRHGLRYPQLLPLARVRLLLLAIWMVALCHALALAMPWTYHSADGRIFCFCMITNVTSNAYLLLIIILPFAVLLLTIATYTAVILVAIRFRVSKQLPADAAALSLASQFWRIPGLPSLSLIVFLTTVFWLPLLVGLMGFVIKHNHAQLAVFWNISAIFVLLNSCINPLVFTLGYRKYRIIIWKMLKNKQKERKHTFSATISTDQETKF